MLGFASLFTGGGGAELGAIQAGLTPIFGVEKDPEIAKVFEVNFPETLTINADIKRVLLGRMIEFKDPIDWLHASPPCVRASSANNGKEAREDIDLAQAVCRAIEILKPAYFSLENVRGYQKFKAFEKIEDWLSFCGYDSITSIYNVANYGVPQDRYRLFLVAKKGKLNFFDLPKQKPMGWYEAIADLIPTLKPTGLTDSQKECLKSRGYDLENLPDLAIRRNGHRKVKGIPAITICPADKPIFTILARSGKVRPSPKQATLIIDGKPYEADTRCVARWQTFPDDYQWSGDLKLDTKIIGNAVPPKFFAQLIKEVLHDI
jgi:DNA (cytosine-5)-methyltransferase 1